MKKTNSKKPKISVIIPCYNHGHFIKDAISSVEKSKFKNYEIIIVNDGSSNKNTCKILKDLEKKSYFVRRHV